MSDTKVKHVTLNQGQKVQVWEHVEPMLYGNPIFVDGAWSSNPGGSGWRHAAGTPVVNNRTVAAAVATVVGFPVSKSNINSLRRAYGYDFRDPPDHVRGKGKSKERLKRLEAAYTDLYEWATRQGYVGINRIAE